jgi:hypothetical protein
MIRTNGTREGTAPLCRGTARTTRGTPAKPQVRLSDVQSSHGPPDQHALDLRRSLEDREDLGGTGSLRRSAACGPRGISTDSARPVRDECRFRVGPCPIPVVVRTHAEKAPIHLRGCHQQPAPQRVHLRYILALTCDYRCPRYSAAHAPRGRAAQALTPGNAIPRAGRCHAVTAERPYTPALATPSYGANVQGGDNLERAWSKETLTILRLPNAPNGWRCMLPSGRGRPIVMRQVRLFHMRLAAS